MKLPGTGPEHTLSNHLLDYIDRLKGAPLQRNVHAVTARAATGLALRATADAFLQVTRLGAKAVILTTERTIRLLTLGRRGTFARNITAKDLVDHARGATRSSVDACKHTMSSVASIARGASFTVQAYTPISRDYRALSACTLFTWALAAADAGSQVTCFTLKVLALTAQKIIRMLTCGRWGTFAKNIRGKDILEHARKAFWFATLFLAHAVSNGLTLVSSAALVYQKHHPVSNHIQTVTVAILITSACAVLWLNNPDRLVARYRKRGLIVSDDTWKKAVEFRLQEKQSLSFSLRAVTDDNFGIRLRRTDVHQLPDHKDVPESLMPPNRTMGE